MRGKMGGLDEAVGVAVVVGMVVGVLIVGVAGEVGVVAAGLEEEEESGVVMVEVRAMESLAVGVSSRTLKGRRLGVV